MSTNSHSPISDIPRSIFWIAIAFSSFQIYMAAFHPLSSQVIRSIHVGFVLLMIFALTPGLPGRLGKVVNWALAITGFVFSFYHWIYEPELTARAGTMTDE